MRTTIVVQNLKCGGCAKTITSKISQMDHISDLSVDVATAEVTFTHNDPNDVQAVKERLGALGYPPVGQGNSIAAKAVSFVSCATVKMSK